MKTAIIYSGQARTFGQLYENHAWFVHRHFPDAEFFVSVADDAQADDMLRLKESGLPVHFEKVIQPQIPEPVIGSQHHFGYPITVPVQAVLKQLWSLERAYDFFIAKADASGTSASGTSAPRTSAPRTKFPQVVRIRPDSRFTRFERPFVEPHEVHSPWWARWGGVNDRFAVMGDLAADRYFRLFSNRQRLLDKGCPCHPETMLGAWLQMSGITSHDNLACEFMTVRLDGSVRPIDPSVIDVAEYSK